MSVDLFPEKIIAYAFSIHVVEYMFLIYFFECVIYKCD